MTHIEESCICWWNWIQFFKLPIKLKRSSVGSLVTLQLLQPLPISSAHAFYKSGIPISHKTWIFDLSTLFVLSPGNEILLYTYDTASLFHLSLMLSKLCFKYGRGSKTIGIQILNIAIWISFSKSTKELWEIPSGLILSEGKPLIYISKPYTANEGENRMITGIRILSLCQVS